MSRRRDPGDHHDLRDTLPALFAFGAGPIAPLDPARAAEADVEDRIRSVWPFLVGRALDFAETLAARDKANYDAEDVLLDLYTSLRDHDARWEPARGKYITFAGQVVASELSAIRDRIHTIHSPRNSGCRLKQYSLDESAGTLSPRRARTFRDMQRRAVAADFRDDSPEARPAGDGPTEAAEHRRLGIAALLEGVGALPPEEATAIGRLFGLWGQPETDARDLAVEMGVGIVAINQIKARALARLGEVLDARNHSIQGELSRED